MKRDIWDSVNNILQKLVIFEEIHVLFVETENSLPISDQKY